MAGGGTPTRQVAARSGAIQQAELVVCAGCRRTGKAAQRAMKERRRTEV